MQAGRLFSARRVGGEVGVALGARGRIPGRHVGRLGQRPAVAEPLANGRVAVRWIEAQRRIAPGQSVVLYDVTNNWVIAGGIACAG